MARARRRNTRASACGRAGVEASDLVKAVGDIRVAGTQGFLADLQAAPVKRLGGVVFALQLVQDRKVAEAVGDQRMVRAQRLLTDLQTAPAKRLGDVDFALVAIEDAQILEARGQVRVLGAEHLFLDRQGALEERLRGRKLVLPIIRRRQVVEGDGQIGMDGTEGFLVDLQRALEERLRPIQSTLAEVQPRQIIERGRDIIMAGAKDILANFQGALVERFRRRVTPLELVQRRQVVEQFRHCVMLGAEVLLADRQGAQVERLRQRVAALVLVQQGQAVEGGGHVAMPGGQSAFPGLQCFLEQRFRLAKKPQVHVDIAHRVHQPGLDERLVVELRPDPMGAHVEDLPGSDGVSLGLAGIGNLEQTDQKFRYQFGCPGLFAGGPLGADGAQGLEGHRRRDEGQHHDGRGQEAFFRRRWGLLRIQASLSARSTAVGRAAGAGDLSLAIRAARWASMPVTGIVSPTVTFSSNALKPSSRSYAGLPVNNSCRISPKEYRSLAVLASSPRACSGLMYWIVPMTIPTSVSLPGLPPDPWQRHPVFFRFPSPTERNVPDELAISFSVISSCWDRDKPKSSTLTCPSLLSMILSGLRSRWIMPCSCEATSTRAICSAMLSFCLYSIPLCITSERLWPGIISSTRKSAVSPSI